MKKYFLLAILAGASVFVSAQTFKLSGHVRSGISTAFDGAKGEAMTTSIHFPRQLGQRAIILAMMNFPA